MAYLGKTIERDMYVGAKAQLFKYAKEMRNNPTESEKILWKELKKLRFKGFIFRRQHPIDLFIADFYCHKLKLVIEVDGEIHLDEKTQEYDNGRSGELEKFGITVYRITNDHILNNKELVMNNIIEFIAKLTSSSLLGEGDKRGSGK